MELLGHLEGRVLGEMRDQLRRSCPLDRVPLSDLCSALLQQLLRAGVICKPRLRHKHREQVGRYTRLACELFDIVDVDSRGVLHFDDFTSFCLRSARNALGPVAPRETLEFVQEVFASAPMPSQRLYFVPSAQMLLGTSPESPQVHVFGPGRRYLGAVDPLNELRKLVAVCLLTPKICLS